MPGSSSSRNKQPPLGRAGLARDTSSPDRISLLFTSFALIAIAWDLAPLWRETLSWASTRDWQYFYFLSEVERKTILEYHQFPFWNPYYCGGAVHLANPQTFFLSATFPFILLFGPAIGLRLTLTATLLLAFDSTRRLARALGLGTAAAAVSGGGYALSGAFHQHLGGGHIGWFGFALFPYVLHAFLRALDGSRRHIVFGALFLAWIIGHFGVYPFPYSCIGLSVFAAAIAWHRRAFAPAIRVVLQMLAFALGFAALRLLPLVDFIRDHPREVHDGDAVSPLEFPEIYALRHTDRVLANHNWVWPEYGNYLGLIGVALALSGLVIVVRRRRALLPIAICLGAFLLFQIGNVPLFPWWLIKHLPIFNHLRVPSRFTIVAGLFACLLAGVAVDEWFPRLGISKTVWRIRTRAALVLLATIAFFFDAASFNRQRWQDAIGTPPPEAHPAEFTQTRGDQSRMHEYPRLDRGSLNCFEESPLDISPALATGLPAEEYLQDPTSGTLRRVRWTPNRIDLDADITTDVNSGIARDAIVVVNQNYERRWFVTGGTLINHRGLLAARISSGHHRVVFRYLPWPFFAGLLVTLLSLAQAFRFIRRAPGSPS